MCLPVRTIALTEIVRQEGSFTRVHALHRGGTYIQKCRKVYTTGYPPPDADVAERSGCGCVDDSRRADCCDQLASQWRRARTALGRCRVCDQPSMPAWINTRSGIRKGIRLPISGSEPVHHMFARKHMVQMCAPDPRPHPGAAYAAWLCARRSTPRSI